MHRRDFLSVVGLAPLASLPALAAAPSIETMPRDPQARILKYLYIWHQQFIHKWDLPHGTLLYAYAGAGWPRSEVPAGHFSHRTVLGEGSTALAAVDDWWSRMPQEAAFGVVWRNRPELAEDYNFDSKTRSFAVHSRFAIIPQERDII